MARKILACFCFSLSRKRWLRIVETLPALTVAAISESLIPAANSEIKRVCNSLSPVQGLSNASSMCNGDW